MNLTRGGVREKFDNINEDTKLKISQSVKRYFEELDDFTPFQKFKGKHHSEETKKEYLNIIEQIIIRFPKKLNKK